MPRHLRKELEKLKLKLLGLSSIVEECLGKSVRAIEERNVALAEEILSRDDEIDMLEVEVEEDCLKLLALYQPVASDLRFVVAILKINNDLERIGDLAVTIAQRCVYLSNQPAIEAPFDLADMSRKTRLMLKRALDSLIELDGAVAHQVCRMDEDVDSINRAMYSRVYEKVKSNPEHAESLIHYLTISRTLERIADYATNIAEDVIYMIEGNIVRHDPDVGSSTSANKGT